MATKSTSDRLSYGLTILIFGFLFLLQKIGILSQIPYAENLISIGFFFLIAGIVFVITQPRRVLSWLFLVIGVLLNADIFFSWMSNYSKFLIPLALIIVGMYMVFTSKK